MKPRRQLPPRLAESLLRRCIPRGLAGHGILGDLREEYAGIGMRHTGVVASAWYWANAVLLSVQYCLPTRSPGEAAAKKSTSRRSGGYPMETFARDVRFAVRTLLKRPGFTAIVIATFAVGIGGTVAMFSVINSAFIDTLPYRDPGQLVFGTGRKGSGNDGFLSAWDFFDYREQSDVFESLEAIRGFDISVTVTGNATPERVSEREISTGLFSTLGVAPAVGRDFTRDEEEVTAGRVAILSFGFWQRRFGGERNAVGGTIVIDDRPHTIVGVMPRQFDFMSGTEVWTALRRDTPWGSSRGPQNWYAVGRLRDRVSITQAQEQVNVIGQRLADEYPETNHGRGMHLSVFRERLVRRARPMLLVLTGAVGFVLLVACANVAGLLLARGVARSGEMAIRSTLGASRGHLLRQLLTESVLIAAVGGLLGLSVTHWLLQLLKQFAPADLPGLRDLGVDGTALLIALTVSVITGLLVGIVPALRSANSDIPGQLSLGRRISDGLSSTRLRGTLVVAQVTLSLVLLIGSGLMMRSLLRLQSVDPGFEAGGLLTAEVALPQGRYSSGQEVSQFYGRLAAQIATRPGAVAAGAINRLPIAHGGGDWPVYAEDNPPADLSQRRSALIRTVTNGYFQTMQIPLLAGRVLTAEDTPDAPPAVVVDEAWVDRFLPGGNPVGKNLVLGNTQQTIVPIVGLVGRVHGSSLSSDPYPTVYFSVDQWPQRTMSVVVRTTSDPHSFTNSLRAVVAELDANVPVAKIATMRSVMSDSIAQQRRTALLVGAFATVALLLATLGLYGVLAHFVNQRSHEIGVRIALGAESSNVLGLVLRRGLALVAAGLLLGIAGATAITRFMQSLLYGVAATDLATFIVVSTTLGIVAAAACVLPALKAVRIDPLAALRTE